ARARGPSDARRPEPRGRGSALPRPLRVLRTGRHRGRHHDDRSGSGGGAGAAGVARARQRRAVARMPEPFVARLAERPLLCDAAMGTMLYARGVPLDTCFDVLCVNDPKVVQGIHAEYIAAGADCIETNTFGANRFKLGVHGLGGRVREINLRGVKLARDVRESMGRDVFVLGSIGPLGKYLAPLGSI